MKIVILDGYTENPGDLSWNGFEALGEVTVYDRTPFADGSGEIVRRAKGADILIVNKTPLSAETLAELAPELRYIGVLATGYNVVDTAAAKAQGVPVCNIPTYGTAAVAQFVMALLLELCHHVGDHSRSVKEGGWSSCPTFATGIRLSSSWRARRSALSATGASAGQRRSWPRPSAWRCLLSISSRRTTAWRAW